MEEKIIKAAKTINENPQFEILTRFGYVANGVLHGLVGLAVIAVAFGSPEEIDQSGILAPLTRHTYGTVLLILICLGLLSLGLSHIINMILTRKNQSNQDKWPARLRELGKGVAYLALGSSSLSYIFARATAPNSVNVSEDSAAHLLALPAGAVILFVMGLGILLLGANFIYRGVSRKFAEALDLRKIRLKQPVIILGIAGYIAKGLAFIPLGFIVCQAAVTLNPLKASGLNGAFKILFTVPFGTQLLFLLGIGFILYAVYCVARGIYAKL